MSVRQTANKSGVWRAGDKQRMGKNDKNPETNIENIRRSKKNFCVAIPFRSYNSLLKQLYPQMLRANERSKMHRNE